MTDSPSHELYRGLVALSQQLLRASASLSDALHRVAALATEVVPACDSTTITAWERGHPPTTVASTDDVDLRIDEAQYQALAGPCLEAIRHSRVVRIDSIVTAEPRWEAFAREALRAGVRSSMSLPLLVEAAPIGAMNLYSKADGTFDDDDERTGSAFAASAAVAVANFVAYWGAVEEGQHLHVVIGNRAVIEQAKGILMGREGCNADVAFDMLRRAAERENRTVQVVACELLADQGPTPRHVLARVDTPAFSIRRNGDLEGRVHVEAVGEIDRTVDGLLSAFFDAIPQPSVVTLDLTAVSFVDSSGLGTLLGFARSVRDGGGVLTTIPSQPVRRLARLTAITRQLGFTDL